MTPIQEIEQDLDWREAEMASLRILLADTGLSEKTKRVLFRAAWALLYAHFEGFCKLTLTIYYDALKECGKTCRDLAPTTQAFALTDTLREIRKLPSSDFISQILNFETDVMSNPANFPEVDTRSNLWPNVLEQLLNDADIELPSLASNKRAISTLVNRRNKISHGERELIPEFTYYLSFEEAAKSVMYDLALAVDAKLAH